MIYLTKGNTTELLFALTNGAGGIIDLTGKGVTFIVRDNGAIAFTLRSTAAGGSDDEIEILDAVNGKIKVTIDSALTSSLVHRDMVLNIYVDADSIKTDSVRFFPFTNTTNVMYSIYGTTAQRPSLPQGLYIGFIYFDTDEDANIVWNGSEWVDNVDALDSRVTQNEADIATNDTELADHESRISTNEADIATNDTELADHESRISTNETELDDTMKI